MKFLTLNEGKEWLRSYGFDDIRCLKWGDLKNFKFHISYLLPADSGVKTSLAKYLSIFFEAEGEGFFWITEHEVWPSSDNKDLFYAYRNFIGESRSIDDVPCHIFVRSDKTTLKNLISLVLYFFYDAVLVKKFSDSMVVVYLSHDEIIEVFSDASGRIMELKESLGSSYKFTPIK